MIEERYNIIALEYVDGGESKAEEARIKYKPYFPGRSARRMTHLGMMISICIQKLELRQNLPIVFASEFGESASLEKFIDSFPEASPALFQSSIHPSSVEQALVPKKQAINRFYPITGNKNLIGNALENCFLLGEREIVLLGGEERGSWLCEYGLASEKSFAFGMRLSAYEESIGCVSIDRSESIDTENDLDFWTVAKRIESRQAIRVPSFALNAWIRIDWK